MPDAALLQVERLSRRFAVAGQRGSQLFAVDDINFELRPGESLGLVGESGCGKSLTALAIMGLLPESAQLSGAITFDGLALPSLGDQAMGRVRMTTQPSPHVGLGVAQYSWASSPLRRAADFINQQQLVAMLQGTPPRYAPRDPMLFAALRDFDQTYNAYAEFQGRMERYWCLKWLEQEGVREIGATVIKENLVRFDGLPLILRIAGLPELARGTPVKLQLISTDYLDLALECRLLEAGEPVAVVEEEEEVAEAAEVPEELAEPAVAETPVAPATPAEE